MSEPLASFWRSLISAESLPNNFLEYVGLWNKFTKFAKICSSLNKPALYWVVFLGSGYLQYWIIPVFLACNLSIETNPLKYFADVLLSSWNAYDSLFGRNRNSSSAWLRWIKWGDAEISQLGFIWNRKLH